MIDLEDISQSLQSGKARETSALITKAIQENYSVESILRHGLIPGMNAVEERFRKNEIFIPEVLVATRAMNMGIKTLRPCLAVSEARGTVIVGTVKGEMQDTEKNLIAIMIEGIGLKVVDLGAGVPPERFIETAKKENAQIIICSAMRTATMHQMKMLIQAVTAAGIRSHVKIMVTGYPVTEKYCNAIGADFYAPDAVSAAEAAAAHCGKKLK
jgi:methanogenic corrinoid protein MtbC1